MAHYYDQWKDEGDLLRERAERAEEMVADLRRRLAAVEAERDALRDRLAPDQDRAF